MRREIQIENVIKVRKNTSAQVIENIATKKMFVVRISALAVVADEWLISAGVINIVQTLSTPTGETNKTSNYRPGILITFAKVSMYGSKVYLDRFIKSTTVPIRSKHSSRVANESSNEWLHVLKGTLDNRDTSFVSLMYGKITINGRHIKVRGMQQETYGSLRDDIRFPPRSILMADRWSRFEIEQIFPTGKSAYVIDFLICIKNILSDG